MTKNKRLKQVFTRSEDVARLFAAQSQEYAVSKYNSRRGERGLYSSFFRGVNMYSFGEHYLLARIGLKLNGVPIAIVNWTHYSRMTSDQQWEVKRALEKKGFLVLEAREKLLHGDLIKAGISDADLIDLAVEKLKEDAAQLKKDLNEMPVKPWNHWQLKEFRALVNRHNGLIMKLKLTGLRVSIDESAIKAGFKLSRLEDAARADFRKRRQDELFGVSWRESKQLRRLAV